MACGRSEGRVKNCYQELRKNKALLHTLKPNINVWRCRFSFRGKNLEYVCVHAQAAFTHTGKLEKEYEEYLYIHIYM